MLRNLLTNSSLPDGYQKIGVDLAALYALIGFAVVFAGIAFLILVVWLVGRVMNKAQTSHQPKKAPVVAKEPALTPATQSQSDDLDEETVAVIMAALTAYYENNYPKCEFTVKRIKRIRRNDYA